jgi:hypothetical protein
MRLAPDSGLSVGDRTTPRLREGAWRMFADDAEAKRLD